MNIEQRRTREQQMALQASGLSMWRAEHAGDVVPPAGLRVLRRRYGWTSQQINSAFEALSAVTLRATDRGYVIFSGDLTSREASLLTEQRLIRLDVSGWGLTRKGEEMFDLLLAYGNPMNRWTRPPLTLGR